VNEELVGDAVEPFRKNVVIANGLDEMFNKME
jgi:hypothetical protein